MIAGHYSVKRSGHVARVNEALQSFVPQFNNPDHIEINELFKKIESKKYREDEENSMKSRIIYLIKNNK